MSDLVVCVDVGSTFTKAALVDVGAGTLLATAEHPTTLDTDVLDGLDACRHRLEEQVPGAASAEVRACSSAGGGLRIAVVGNEALVTAEAGRRVALSSGGRVVHVGSGGLNPAAYDALVAARPDVVLLVGGTDGGNAEVIEADGAVLAGSGWDGPVVVAGNVDAQPSLAAGFEAADTPYVLAANVVPRIGILAPDSARRAVREMFLRHVIGGKHLSARADFAAMVRGATPDVVLTAVELLARGVDETRPGVGDVVVVDVGGATTDVYSAVEIDPEEAQLAHDVVAPTPLTRTVEADLGMRWSAPGTIEAAYADGLLPEDRLAGARLLAQGRHQHPGYLPDGAASAAFDVELAALAVGVAVRRHAGRAVVTLEEGGRVERSGVDLREIRLVVGSGGALRHAPDAAAHLLDHLSAAGGWQVPESPGVVVDTDYVLAPAGLLAADHPHAALALLSRLRPGA